MSVLGAFSSSGRFVRRRLKTAGSVESAVLSRVFHSRSGWPSKTLLYAFFLRTSYISITNQLKLQIYEREHDVGGTWRVSSYSYLVILNSTTDTAQPTREQDNTYPVRTEFLPGTQRSAQLHTLSRSHLTLIRIQSFALGYRAVLVTSAHIGTPTPKTRTLIGALPMLPAKIFSTTGSTSLTSTNSAHTFSATPSWSVQSGRLNATSGRVTSGQAMVKRKM